MSTSSESPHRAHFGKNKHSLLQAGNPVGSYACPPVNGKHGYNLTKTKYKKHINI